ncbi:hypothetical protein BKG89_04975 [Rodentibacter caecimuris]|uniref:Uncharacterized protein n=1 Tax=Rodentibacter caecimuris TaxID=1796644 RepID=A0ABX3KXN4_9PAST|nr:hypothetical protein BKG89_04975 [Rodentibacter heylii]
MKLNHPIYYSILILFFMSCPIYIEVFGVHYHAQKLGIDIWELTEKNCLFINFWQYSYITVPIGLLILATLWIKFFRDFLKRKKKTDDTI